jgi:transposase-like protein
MLDRPLSGVHYPGSLAEVRAWFPDDAACLDYLDWLRWRDGFVCPHCEGVFSWRLRDGRHACGDCKYRVSPTAGTIFHRTRTPLTVWFEAAWLMMTPKNGTSALNLQRVLGLGSYQTAWAMLHRYRDVMVVPARDQLSGDVEMDETFVGAKNEPGKRGRGAAGKVMAVGAIERAPGGRMGFGRARLTVVPDAKGDTLRAFVAENVAPGSLVISDALSSYPVALRGTACEHNPINVRRSGLKAHELLPGVHRLFSLFKRWLMGTHQGAVDPDHLQSYLDEFIFRSNRRNARQRGLLSFRLLERSVEVGPITFRELVAVPAPTGLPGTIPGKRSWPGTLAVAALDRPWRSA